MVDGEPEFDQNLFDALLNGVPFSIVMGAIVLAAIKILGG